MSVPAPMCLVCTRFREAKGDLISCDAFPEGIPPGILDSVVDHRVPVEGDRGLQFDLAPGEEEQDWWPTDREKP